MSVPSVDAWLDEDGEHVWVEHPCVDGVLSTEMLTNIEWSVGEGGWVRPSVICAKCGAHQFVNVRFERWNRPELRLVT